MRFALGPLTQTTPAHLLQSNFQGPQYSESLMKDTNSHLSGCAAVRGDTLIKESPTVTLEPHTPNPKLNEGSLPSSDRPRTLAEDSKPGRMAERTSRKASPP